MLEKQSHVYAAQLCLYAAQFIFSLKAKQLGHALYWAGALILTIGVMLMK